MINFLPNVSLKAYLSNSLYDITSFISRTQGPRLFSKLLHVNLFLYQKSYPVDILYYQRLFRNYLSLRCLKQGGHGLCRARHS